MKWILSGLLFLGLSGAFQAFAEDKTCESVDKKRIKIEGYIAKIFRKQRKKIFKEFGRVGSTRVALRVYPMGETSKVIAVGRCVPVHIAQHIIKKSMKYSTGIESLVQQQFVHSHWVGVGVTMFDEPSQQIVSTEQVQKLLNEDLSDEQFHALYRKMSVPDERVPYFGMKVPNVKTAQPQ